MKYKVKETGEIGTWVAEDSKSVFLRFKDKDYGIAGYSRDEVEVYPSPQKSESLKRKEDALKTIAMLRIEGSKHWSIAQEFDTLLNRLEHEIIFIEVGDSDV